MAEWPRCPISPGRAGPGSRCGVNLKKINLLSFPPPITFYGLCPGLISDSPCRKLQSLQYGVIRGLKFVLCHKISSLGQFQLYVSPDSGWCTSCSHINLLDIIPVLLMTFYTSAKWASTQPFTLHFAPGTLSPPSLNYNPAPLPCPACTLRSDKCNPSSALLCPTRPSQDSPT